MRRYPFTLLHENNMNIHYMQSFILNKSWSYNLSQKRYRNSFRILSRTLSENAATHFVINLYKHNIKLFLYYKLFETHVWIVYKLYYFYSHLLTLLWKNNYIYLSTVGSLLKKHLCNYYRTMRLPEFMFL